MLVDELFGDSVFSVSIPAVVREGDLAPFAELAWLTTPTPTENDWLAAQGERFAELTTALSDPAYGSTGFFAWLDERYDDGEPPDAALRMVHAGLMALPDGARLSERHRHDPSADDWVLLIEGWAAHLRTTGEDDAVLDRIRAVLPSVGYQLTRRGIRRGRSPVDRVLARSEAKVVALTQIVEAEHRGLGDADADAGALRPRAGHRDAARGPRRRAVAGGRLGPSRAAAPRGRRCRTCTRCSSPAGPSPGRPRR